MAEDAAPWVTTAASSFPVSQLPPHAQSTVLSNNLHQIAPFLLPSCPRTYKNALEPMQKFRAWFLAAYQEGAIYTVIQQRKK